MGMREILPAIFGGLIDTAHATEHLRIHPTSEDQLAADEATARRWNRLAYEHGVIGLRLEVFGPVLPWKLPDDPQDITWLQKRPWHAPQRPLA
jgi:hypothetical protein